jgi:hypothetical protein
VKDVALFLRRYQKGLKKQGYKVVKRKFPNKKKRLCYNYGSTKHPLLIVLMKSKTTITRETRKRARPTTKKSERHMGEAHIGHEWDSTKDSSSKEDKKIATVAIHKPSSTPRLFNNMFDDDYYSPHICLMAKGEKVKPKSKFKPPPLVTPLVVIQVITLVMMYLVIKKLIT